MSSRDPYHEELLHWVWKNRQFARGPLLTTEGKEVLIHDPGTPNYTDGPDFKNAQISIGKLKWHGDVEIHWKAQDWFQHGHHTDSNYKSVVLHVVFAEDKRSGNTHLPALPTLIMEHFLDKPLYSFFESYQSKTGLPCSEKLAYISPKALSRQIDKAHRQYFEQKVDDLLRYYNPELPPSTAWQHLVITALFDGLGIAHNRLPMKNLAQLLLEKQARFDTPSELKKFALRKAGIQKPKKECDFNWKRKGSRPVNHPKARIAQGCEMLWFIKNKPFEFWLKSDVNKSFEACIQNIKCKPGVGKQRAGVLFGTVWLPVIYLLGELFGSKKLASGAQQTWLKYRTSLPASITRPFQKANVPVSIYGQKLGTVHQLRAYCRSGRCHRCKVFKSVINS